MDEVTPRAQKTYIAVYRTAFWQDPIKQAKIKAYSVEQAQALADLRAPGEYKLYTIFEPHDVRPSEENIEQYQVGDCFKTQFEEDGTKAIFKITEIKKRIIKYEQHSSKEIWSHGGYGIGKKQFARMWRSREQTAPEKITPEEFNKLKSKYKYHSGPNVRDLDSRENESHW